MSESEPAEPAPVVEAHRRSRRVTLATVVASLSIVPMAMGAKAAGVDPSVVVWSWVGLLGVGAVAVPWRRYMRDLELIREHGRLQARQELGLSEGQAAAETPVADDPLRAMAERIVKLAGEDASVQELVEQVMARRAELQQDLASLEEAVAMEAAVDGESGRRHSRLQQVVDARKSDLQRLTDALRDLHVELTVRSDADPASAVARVDHLLASLSTETELVALDSGSPAAESARAPRERAVEKQL